MHAGATFNPRFCRLTFVHVFREPIHARRLLSTLSLASEGPPPLSVNSGAKSNRPESLYLKPPTPSTTTLVLSCHLSRAPDYNIPSMPHLRLCPCLRPQFEDKP
ncbi:hypothetical protein K523DRAFT_160393 [Schizophyllum commune Tattone D]|nr:hypothetical protein K523DRAFT_160393 [Schizophyllum commune Tattone D]